jgi:hypothetical protein
MIDDIPALGKPLNFTPARNKGHAFFAFASPENALVSNR